MYVYKTELIQLWFYLWNGFFLLNGKAFHKPSVLLGCQVPCFLLVAGPLELTVCKTLIAQQPSVTFIQKSFHPVIPASAEKEQASWFSRIQAKRAGDYRYKTIDPFSKISIAGA